MQMSDTPRLPVTDDPWRRLRRFTDARIALGRSGTSLPTKPHLEFQLAHAQARDAVHLPLDVNAIEQALAAQGHRTLRLHSAARDRSQYLQRPDLGRSLDAPSAARAAACRAEQATCCDLAFVVADGLSAAAIHHHATAFLATLLPRIADGGWTIAPVAIVEQGRVAVGDEIGQALGVRLLAVLIGERPGLSSPDSMGVYFTYAPHVGCTDAQRNCISNIRKDGLAYAEAAHKLAYLMREATRRGLSGVGLKDESNAVQRLLTSKSFLTDG